jgi:two-component system chemotaxis response regulator CheY
MTEQCASGGRPILVIEDDEDIRDFVSAFLDTSGYTVVVAANGSVALEIIDRAPPRAILLDMKMPVMDGWEFARQYHQQSEPQAPIIVMTAAHDGNVRAAEVGAIGMLSKPFDLVDLLRAVERALCPGPRDPR